MALTFDGYMDIYILRTDDVDIDKMTKIIRQRSLKIDDEKWYINLLRNETDKDKMAGAIEKYKEKVKKIMISPAYYKSAIFTTDYAQYHFEYPIANKKNFSEEFIEFIKEYKLDIVVHIHMPEKYTEICVFHEGESMFTVKQSDTHSEKITINSAIKKSAIKSIEKSITYTKDHKFDMSATIRKLYNFTIRI